jgi:hypothetical protein
MFAFNRKQRLTSAVIFGALTYYTTVGTSLVSVASTPRSCGVSTTAWTMRHLPTYPAGINGTAADSIVLAALPAPGGPVLFVSNGTDIYRSSDQACTWQHVYALDPSNPSESPLEGYSVTQLSAARGRVYAVLDAWTFPAVVPTVRILRSDDGGNSWAHADQTLPVRPVQGSKYRPDPSYPPEYFDRLSVAPSDSNVLYLDNGNELFGSDDGGRTWDTRQETLTTLPSQALGSANRPVVCCTIDPLLPRSVWAADIDGVLHSLDGGHTFVRVLATGRPSTDLVAVTHTPGRPATVTLQLNDSGVLLRSTDGGRTFKALLGVPSPGYLTACAGGCDPMNFVALYWRINAGDRTWQLVGSKLHRKLAVFDDLQLPRPDRTALATFASAPAANHGMYLYVLGSRAATTQQVGIRLKTP